MFRFRIEGNRVVGPKVADGLKLALTATHHELEHAEGVSPVVINGVERIIIVSDDGNRKARRCARHMLLDASQLQTAH